MKKFIALMLVGIMLLMSIGCGKTEEVTNVNIADYTGIWTNDGATFDDGGMVLELRCIDEYINVVFSKLQAQPMGRCVTIWEDVSSDALKGNKLTVEFTDSWYGVGTLEITLEQDTVVCNLVEVSYMGEPDYGFSEGVWSLVRNDSFYDEFYLEPQGEEGAEEATEEATEPVTEEATEEATEDAIEPVTEKPTELEAEDLNVEWLNESINTHKLISDLTTNGLNVFHINGADEVLDFVTLKIEKSKNYSTSIDAWLNATLANEFYSVTARYKIYYSLYDIGGWIIDSYSILEHKTTPIKFTPGTDKIKEECAKIFDACEILEEVFTVNEKNQPVHITTFLGTWNAKYVTETHKGTRTFTFSNDYWSELWTFEHYSTDFSKLLGTWQLTHYDEYITINITDASRTKNNYSITYDYKTSPWCDDGTWGGYITNVSFKTDGLPRVEPSVTVEPEYAFDEVDYYKAQRHYGNWSTTLKRTDLLAVEYSWGNWKNNRGDAYNRVYIDVNKGLSIREFHYGYKSPDYVKPPSGTYYETWWGGDDMTVTKSFTKIS